MSLRPPSTYLPVDELKQIAEIKFNKAAPAGPATDLTPTNRAENYGEAEGCTRSKKLEPQHYTAPFAVVGKLEPVG